MIDSHTILSLSFYKYDKPFTGSLNGKRYRILRIRKPEEDGGSEILKVWIYPEPYAFEHTDEAEMLSAEFPYTEEGYAQVLGFLNEHIVEEGQN
ncbi:MAG: GNAT family acetyltransferase [Lachnospiraceae bacterium]|nr:GNAT family acetyltransferase [Lachnospiraceae bacterium]